MSVEEEVEMRLTENKMQSQLMFWCLAIAGIVTLLVVGSTSAQTQKPKTSTKFQAEAPQPIFREYRGVRLNMSMEDARAKLGDAVLRSDELDYFVISPTETAQIAYKARKVSTISVDYTGGVGAPDFMSVVGTTLLERPDGSVYRMIEYQAEGFWVSYNRSAGPAQTVTITLQLIPK